MIEPKLKPTKPVNSRLRYTRYTKGRRWGVDLRQDVCHFWPGVEGKDMSDDGYGRGLTFEDAQEVILIWNRRFPQNVYELLEPGESYQPLLPGMGDASITDFPTYW